MKKNTIKFGHLLNLLLYCFGVVFHTNVVLKKNTFGDRQLKILKLYGINCCCLILKGKLVLSGADDNYKEIGGRKKVVFCFPCKKLSKLRAV